MKKLVVGLTVLFAMNFAQASQALVPGPQQKAVRTLKSIVKCPVVRATAFEVVLDSKCVQDKLETALAHLKSDSYFNQLADRIESTWNYRKYASNWDVTDLIANGPYQEDDEYVHVGARLRYTNVGKLANIAFDIEPSRTVEQAVKAAVEEIEMFF